MFYNRNELYTKCSESCRNQVVHAYNQKYFVDIEYVHRSDLGGRYMLVGEVGVIVGDYLHHSA
jgi:anti-sigma regulatory factor (Ser/Thr protein kinase)